MSVNRTNAGGPYGFGGISLKKFAALAKQAKQRKAEKNMSPEKRDSVAVLRASYARAVRAEAIKKRRAISEQVKAGELSFKQGSQQTRTANAIINNSDLIYVIKQGNAAKKRVSRRVKEGFKALNLKG